MHQFEFNDHQNAIEIDREALAAVAATALSLEGIDTASVSFVFVSDPAIRAINRERLDHDWPTDVITFDLADADVIGVSGEIVISTETALRVAASAGVSPQLETELYLVHGLLHLAGYEDTTHSAAETMHQRCLAILAAAGRDVSSAPFGVLSAGLEAEPRRALRGERPCRLGC